MAAVRAVSGVKAGSVPKPWAEVVGCIDRRCSCLLRMGRSRRMLRSRMRLSRRTCCRKWRCSRRSRCSQRSSSRRTELGHCPHNGQLPYQSKLPCSALPRTQHRGSSTRAASRVRAAAGLPLNPRYNEQQARDNVAAVAHRHGVRCATVARVDDGLKAMFHQAWAGQAAEDHWQQSAGATHKSCGGARVEQGPAVVYHGVVGGSEQERGASSVATHCNAQTKLFSRNEI